jgi:hypothetical protein
MYIATKSHGFGIGRWIIEYDPREICPKIPHIIKT